MCKGPPQTEISVTVPCNETTEQEGLLGYHLISMTYLREPLSFRPDRNCTFIRKYANNECLPVLRLRSFDSLRSELNHRLGVWR